MLKCIELITSENENVIKELSMVVNKSFDLRINLWYVCYLIPRMIYNLSYFMLCLYVSFYDVK